jgi:hypothetical protein
LFNLLPNKMEKFLEDLVTELDIPESRYESAERSYKSVGEWLNRDKSTLKRADPQVYIQGSFRLGTVTRPISDEEDYDVDLVCELKLSKSEITQAQLKTLLGWELREYARVHSMEPPEAGRRCWTLNYAEGAQFHLDSLPALPDGAVMGALLRSRGLSSEWAETAIAITDEEHPGYQLRTPNWPHSNPKGYTHWFRSRMRTVFEARRRALALEARASVEAIPEYRVKTPLQSSIQILKRHRDLTFEDDPENKPISIIITTLAAQAYEQEVTIASALFGILARMDRYIEHRNGVAWIGNPTDPLENFADKWETHPERGAAFFAWLAQARRDFKAAAEAADRAGIVAALAPRLGRRLVEAAASRDSMPGLLSRTGATLRAVGRVLSPSHRQRPPWRSLEQGRVAIRSAAYLRNGFRPQEFSSDSPALPKHASLTFEAATDIPAPYKVYWQVVNTGDEARAANVLRGGFDEGIVERGKLTRREGTLYRGTHSIECFIVKDGYLAARSGQFLVNIQ